MLGHMERDEVDDSRVPERVALDLSVPMSIHLVGIGGAGMSAIATILVEMGHHVAGSDMKDGAVLDRLRALGVAVHIGHAAENLRAADVVAISTAVADSNVEVK